jgi:N-formylglutamate amidohydrolase
MHMNSRSGVNMKDLMQAADSPGFALHNVGRLTVPVLLSVPHAGRDYPDAILAALRLPPASLLRLEDRYADRLARPSIVAHVPAIIAHRARAWIDLNRDERDLDVDMVTGARRDDYPLPSAKQRGGLGLIPRRLSGEGDIWKRPFALSDIEARIAGYHRPYHAAVAQTLRAILRKFGVAVLLDLHSMPPIIAAGPEPVPDFVIGDRFGASASSRFAHFVTRYLTARGHAVALNHPYSGDHMLRHHAAVGRNIHALQLEVARSLYLDAGLREPGSGLAGIAELLAGLVAALADHLSDEQTLIAAE